jgi:hypothetical protein
MSTSIHRPVKIIAFNANGIWRQTAYCTEPELTGPFYILNIRLGFNSKIVNNCTNDNELILPTMTDKRQTRPLVREGAPHGEDSNFQT